MRNKTKPNEEITLKELYERIIVPETKMDGIQGGQLLGRKHSTKLAILIIVSVLIDLIIHGVLFYSTHFQ